MRFKEIIIYFLITFAIVIMVNAIVFYIVTLIRYGAGAVDWTVAFFCAVALGVYFTVLKVRISKLK